MVPKDFLAPVLPLLFLTQACSDPPPATAGVEATRGQPASEQAEAPPLPSIAPSERVAGIAGVELWTQVRFPAGEQKEVPHRLQTLIAFPQRGRWVLAPEVNPLGTVRILYQFGERVFMSEGTGDSVEFVADGQRDQMRHFALRRALLVPEAFEWTDTADGVRTAGLGEAGRLEAHGDADRPARLVTYTAADVLSFHVEDVEWQVAEEGRPWPQSWSLNHADETLWHETFQRGQHVDAVYTTSFLPRDRRDGPAPSAQDVSDGRSSTCWVLLSGGVSADANWDDFEVAAELAVQSEREQGRDIETPATFVLRRDGRPGQIRLVLPESASPPVPWQREEAGELVEKRWTGSEFPPPIELRQSLEELSAEARKNGREPTGAPYVHRLPGGSGVRLVQPTRTR